MLKGIYMLLLALVATTLIAITPAASAASEGVITTVAGSASYGYSGDGGQATDATLNSPLGVALDGSGNLYIADTFNHVIRKVTASTGTIITVAGNGTDGYSGDGGPATAATLSEPEGVAVDGAGNIYISDTDNHRVRKVTVSTGVISTVAGNGSYGFSGDGGPATAARLKSPTGIALDGSGNIYVSDVYNHRIRKITVSTGVISTVAGDGNSGSLGDGGPATAAQVGNPAGLAVDGGANLYIAQRYHDRIRKVTVSTGVISTVAGNGSGGYAGDGGQAVDASLDTPTGVAVDGSGNLYIADNENYVIRKVAAATGVISTVAGNGSYGFSGDGGQATAAALDGPTAVTVAGGNLYIADYWNSRIRMVQGAPLQGLSVTIGGTGKGTVTSSPGGIACISGSSKDCSSTFADSTVTLYASPDGSSTFGGWSGDCQGSAVACSIGMTSNRSVTATFLGAAKVKIANTTYSTLLSACTAAGSGATIQARELDFPENLVFGNVGNGISAILKGGYDAAFSGNAGNYSTISGSLKVRRGRLTVENLKIGPATTATGASYAIAGRVVDSASAAVPGVTVILAGASTMSASTDLGGNYLFTGLGDGSYTVSVRKNGYIMTPSKKTVSVSGANVSGQNFTATTIATSTNAFSGTVAMGAPVEDADVSLQTLDGEIVSALSDAMGGWLVPFSSFRKTLTPPFVVRARFTWAGRVVDLFSVSTDDAGGNIRMNITPVTDMITRAYQPLYSSNPNQVEGLPNNPGKLAQIVEGAKIVLGGLIPAESRSSTDFIKDVFPADPVKSEKDALYERIKVGYHDGNVTIADVTGKPMATTSFAKLSSNTVGTGDAETVTEAEAQAAIAKRGGFQETTPPYVNEAAAGSTPPVPASILPAPANFTPRKTGALTWELSWTPVAGAVQYFIYQQKGAAPSVQPGRYEQSDAGPFLVTGGNSTSAHYQVDTDGTYYWVLAAVGTDGSLNQIGLPTSFVGTPTAAVSLTFARETTCVTRSPADYYAYEKYCYYLDSKGKEKKHGLYEQFDGEADQLMKRLTYADDILDGPAQYYDYNYLSDESPKVYRLGAEGNYLKGEYTGTWQFYHTNTYNNAVEGLGKLDKEATFGISVYGTTITAQEKNYCNYHASVLPAKRGQLALIRTTDLATIETSYQYTWGQYGSCHW